MEFRFDELQFHKKKRIFLYDSVRARRCRRSAERAQVDRRLGLDVVAVCNDAQRCVLAGRPSHGVGAACMAGVVISRRARGVSGSSLLAGGLVRGLT